MTNSSTNSARTEKCAKHGDYSAEVIHIADREIVTPCPACSEDRRAEHAKEERERFIAERARIEHEQRARLYAESGVPYRYRDKGFESFITASTQQERALVYSRQFADAIADNRRCGVSAIFTGNVGTGKTHLATAIVRELCLRGVYARFETVLTAIRSIKDTYRRTSEITETEAVDALVAPALLVVDEVGVQFDTDHERTLFFEILNNRYQESRSTLLLSNLTPVELQTFLGDRVMDRFRENGKVLPFTWESKRGNAR